VFAAKRQRLQRVCGHHHPDYQAKAVNALLSRLLVRVRANVWSSNAMSHLAMFGKSKKEKISIATDSNVCCAMFGMDLQCFIYGQIIRANGGII
jgi:hypothetical protein